MRLLPTRVLLFILFTGSIAAFSQSKESKLFETMQQLDTQLFEAANHCDYEKLTAMVDENLEFYHDQGGLTLGRQAFLDSIKNNTCGVMIRELVPATLQVYPIKGYGAMELGVHRFHHPGHEKEFPAAKQLGMTHFLDPGAAEWPVGEAKFLQIWQLKDGTWRLTRVVSYGH
jgi:Domain of unknown function (DUF4440)